MDRSDIPVNSDWSRSIEENIRAADAILYLWSPEANASENVQKEINLAFECHGPERITRLRVAGRGGDMPAEVSRLQDNDLTEGYWTVLPKLAERLSVTAPLDSSREVFRSLTVSSPSLW